MSNNNQGTVYRLARIVFGAVAGADSGLQAVAVVPIGTAPGCYLMTIPAGSVISNPFFLNLPGGAIDTASITGAGTLEIGVQSGGVLIAATVVGAGLLKNQTVPSGAATAAFNDTITYTVAVEDLSTGAIDVYATITPQSDGTGQGA